jgi:hypothetical protein
VLLGCLSDRFSKKRINDRTKAEKQNDINKTANKTTQAKKKPVFATFCWLQTTFLPLYKRVQTTTYHLLWFCLFL